MKELTSDQSTFLNMIKKPCIDTCLSYKITPSVIAALGIWISNWGMTKEFYKTRNIFLMTADNWYDKCYSLDTGKVYDKPADCDEPGAILFRVYDDHQNSVKDFIEYLMCAKRSKNGPLKYSAIVNCDDYKESINKLVRAGFLKDFLSKSDNPEYIGYLINLIEDYELFNWDNDLKEELNMAKRKQHYHQDEENTIKEVIEENVEEIVTEEVVEQPVIEEKVEEVPEELPVVEEPKFEHMYRVRLDWDKPDTQIYASPKYEDARREALRHEGYKIYIDDDGELFEDPWLKVEANPNKIEVINTPNGIKTVIHPIPGKVIHLENTPVYKMALDKHPFKYLTGTYYFYDNTVVNNRAKITNIKLNANIANPTLILGYIDI